MMTIALIILAFLYAYIGSVSAAKHKQEVAKINAETVRIQEREL